jgi:hypothetical protein
MLSDRCPLRSGRALVHAPWRSAVTEEIEKGNGRERFGSEYADSRPAPGRDELESEHRIDAVCQTTA